MVGSLTIDGQASVSTTLQSTGFISVNTDSPLYAGGVPSEIDLLAKNIFIILLIYF